MAPAHRRVESRCVEMLLEIDGQDVARSFNDFSQGGLLMNVAVRGLSLLLAGRDKRGEPGTRRGSSLTPECGRAVEVSGIGLVSGGLFLDEGETGDAVARIRLHF